MKFRGWRMALVILVTHLDPGGSKERERECLPADTTAPISYQISMMSLEREGC
jgi:hypothetical protein